MGAGQDAPPLQSQARGLRRRPLSLAISSFALRAFNASAVGHNLALSDSEVVIDSDLELHFESADCSGGLWRGRDIDAAH
eukprot:766901-Rhodomonas_salina.2